MVGWADLFCDDFKRAFLSIVVATFIAYIAAGAVKHDTSSAKFKRIFLKWFDLCEMMLMTFSCFISQAAAP